MPTQAVDRESGSVDHPRPILFPRAPRGRMARLRDCDLRACLPNPSVTWLR